MTEQKHRHTLEPWINDERYIYAIQYTGVTESPRYRFSACLLAGPLTPVEELIANAKRIVDCVNAFEGIEDPQAFMEKYKKSQGE